MIFSPHVLRRSVDYKQVLFCFVLETGIQRTLTSNPDQGQGSIPIGSWKSSCSSEKHLNSYEADDDRVWDEGEGTRRGGGGENSQEKDRDTLRLAFIGVKNCRSRPHLWCAGLKDCHVSYSWSLDDLLSSEKRSLVRLAINNDLLFLSKISRDSHHQVNNWRRPLNHSLNCIPSIQHCLSSLIPGPGTQVCLRFNDIGFYGSMNYYTVCGCCKEHHFRV